MLLNCGAGEDSWEFLGKQDQISQSLRKSTLNTLWNKWCWSWSSNTLATWWEELTHWKRSWCWGRMKAGGEGVDRGWDGSMASPTQWTWVWANSRSWWWTRRPGVLHPWGHKEWDTTEWLNWTDSLMSCYFAWKLLNISSRSHCHNDAVLDVILNVVVCFPQFLYKKTHPS